jgi:hypothetical protein
MLADWCAAPPPLQPDNILGGWDQEMFEDLMQQYDDDEGEEGEYDDYDAPATDY